MENDLQRVADVMTRDVAVIRISSDVRELEKLLLERGVHGAPVVNADEVLVGVVSQTDLLAWHHDTEGDGGAFYDYSNLLVKDDEEFKGLRMKDIRTAGVEEVMSPMVHCIRSERPIAVAASAMITERIHRLVVVDDQLHVLGIVSALDLLKAVPGVEKLVGERVDAEVTETAS